MYYCIENHEAGWCVFVRSRTTGFCKDNEKIWLKKIKENENWPVQPRVTDNNYMNTTVRFALKSFANRRGMFHDPRKSHSHDIPGKKEENEDNPCGALVLEERVDKMIPSHQKSHSWVVCVRQIEEYWIL